MTRPTLLTAAGLVGLSASAFAQFSTPQFVDQPMLDSRGVDLGDLDGDGLTDLVVAAANNDLVGWMKGDGAGHFGQVQVLTTQANGANFARVGDLDGDGDLDVVGGSFYDGSVRVWENLGGGAFGPTVLEANAVLELNDLELVDVTGDGVLDILTASSAANRIAVLEGNGDTTFKHIKVLVAPNVDALGVAAGDIDGDGLLDVIGTHGGGNNTNWFRNLGGGNFAAGVDLAGLPKGRDVDALDGDGDGDADLLLSGSGLSYYENLGGGVFAAPITAPGSGKKHIRLADLDGDGDLDAAVGSEFSSSGSLYRNDGGGVFSGSIFFPNIGGKANYDIAFGDLDGDGVMDFATTSQNEDVPRVYLGNGPGIDGGAVAVALAFPSCDGPLDVAAGDLDGDGLGDLVSASLLDGRLNLYRGLGAGAYAAPEALLDGEVELRRVRLADFNGDGVLDIAAMRGATGGAVRILFGDGSGGFLGPFSVIHSAALTEMEVGDFDGDGAVDIVLLRQFQDTVEVYTNTGGGHFSKGPNLSPGLNAPERAFVADVDGNGFDDVVVAYQTDGVFLYKSFGGTLSTPGLKIGTAAQGSRGLDAGDVDGDGDLDIVMASKVQGEIRIAYQLSPGFFGFGTLEVLAGSTNLVDIELGDVDNDGLVDLVTASDFNSDVVVRPGDGLGGFGAPVELANDPYTYSALDLADLDGDGDLDVAFTSSGGDNVGVVLNEAAFTDCDGNGVYDVGELANGTATDLDGNGVLDVCMAPPLYADVFAIDASAGGVQTFALDAGPAHAGEVFVFAGSLSGTSPGTPLGGLSVPLVVDAYTNLLITTSVVPLSPKVGLLDANGQASATLNLAPGVAAAYVGMTAHHAFVTYSGGYTFASNAVPVTIE